MAGTQTDFSLFMRDQSRILDNFGFLEFIQIFVLGDTHLLMSTSPRATVGLFGQDGDIIPDDSRSGNMFLGDPIKNTMMLQSIRRLPILTAVPVVLTVVLVVIDVFMLLNPMTHRIIATTPLAPLVAPFIGTGSAIEASRKKRSLDGVGQGKGRRRFSHSVASLTETVLWALEKKGWLEATDPAGLYSEEDRPVGSVPGYQLGGEDEPGWSTQGEQLRGNESDPTDQDRRGSAWKEGLPEYPVPFDTKLEVLVRETVGSFADILPQMGACLGNLIGCHVRLVFWGNTCKPYGMVVTCAGLVGRSISHLLGVLGRQEILYPIH